VILPHATRASALDAGLAMALAEVAGVLIAADCALGALAIALGAALADAATADGSCVTCGASSLRHATTTSAQTKSFFKETR
jgi:hypothetical protein